MNTLNTWSENIWRFQKSSDHAKSSSAEMLSHHQPQFQIVRCLQKFSECRVWRGPLWIKISCLDAFRCNDLRCNQPIYDAINRSFLLWWLPHRGSSGPLKVPFKPRSKKLKISKFLSGQFREISIRMADLGSIFIRTQIWVTQNRYFRFSFYCRFRNTVDSLITHGSVTPYSL